MLFMMILIWNRDSFASVSREAQVDTMELRILSVSLAQRSFCALKYGVGDKPKGWDLADHVLGRFSTEDRKLVDEAIEKAAKAVDIMISQGVDAAMNEYNRKVPAQK